MQQPTYLDLMQDIPSCNNCSQSLIVPNNCSSGDLSYGDCVGRLWDSYGEMIAPVSSQLPWMVSPGNHEIEQIFVKEIDINGK